MEVRLGNARLVLPGRMVPKVAVMLGLLVRHCSYGRRRPESWDMTYEDAKELLHPLKLRSINEFKELCKQGKLPNVPHDPYGLFKDKGWVDWADLLGYPRRHLRSTDRLPFQEAKKII